MRNLLIITATVQPPKDAIGLVRVDPELRMNDYLQAFQFYLDQIKLNTFDRIIFVDNSNSADQVSRIEELARAQSLQDRVEFVVYEGLDYPSSFGRTYGEFKLIHQAYERSQFLRERQAGDVVWKVTGRYMVRNIDRLVRKRPASADFYCNCRSFPKPYADLYLLAWSERGYEHFVRGLYEKVSVEHTLEPGERLVYDLLQIRGPELKIVPRFNVTPVIDGVRGFSNRPFLDSRERWKYYLRTTLLRVTPWIWI